MTKKSFLTLPIRYSNLKYYFTIHFPAWWNKNTIVSHTITKNGEKYISFVFRNGRTINEPIFTIIISPFDKTKWLKRYADSPLLFLGELNNHTYSYILPGELPEAFLKRDKLDYDYKKFGKQIHLMVKMVDLVPAILKSFRFIG